MPATPQLLATRQYKKLLADLRQIIGAGKQEAERAGQATTLTLVILAQIVVVLLMVGWLSRSRKTTGAALAGGQLATVER